MKNKNTVINATIILLTALALCFASVYGSKLASQDDLGQIAYMLVIFFPVTSAITGALTRFLLPKIIVAPLIVMAAFIVTMLTAFQNINFSFVLGYMLISIIAYLVTGAIKSIFRR